MSNAQQAEQLAGKTRTELLKLATDPRLSDDVQMAARDALTLITQGNLSAAVANFDKATAEFSALTDKLVALTEKARAKPGGVVGFIAPILQELGAIQTAVAGVSVETLPAATSP